MNIQSSIILVGAGQLGSRYLQGLQALETQASITVVDPSDHSLEIARQRLSEVPSNPLHNIQFSTSLSPHQSSYDLAIVATPANCRSQVISDVLDCSPVNAWILEKVLAQNTTQLSQIHDLLYRNPRVWVNTPLRIMPWYHDLRSNLLVDDPHLLDSCITGGAWGLACNSIHYIDLFSWMFQLSVTSINASGLTTWYPSKRQGFFDVHGSLEVAFSNGSKLRLISEPINEPLVIHINTSKGTWTIHESEGRAIGPNGQQLLGKIIPQSSLTASVVSRILVQGDSNLTRLDESIAQHNVMLAALLEHWKTHTNQNYSSVPIT